MKRFVVSLVAGIFPMFPITVMAHDFTLPPVLQDLLKRGVEQVFVIGVRNAEEFNAGHLPKSVNIPLDTVPAAVNPECKKDAVAAYCAAGVRSAKAVKGSTGAAQVAPVAVVVCLTDSVVAQVGNRSITGGQLTERVNASFQQVEQARYQILSSGLDSQVGRALLELEAASRKISVDDLIEQEIIGKVPPPDEAVVARALAFDHASTETPINTASTDEIEKLRQGIILMMMREEGCRVRQAFIATLKDKYPVTINLDSPVVAVKNGSLPLRGAANAPVTLVMFSDYECPFCREAEATVTKLLAVYPEKIKVYYRDLPLAQPDPKTVDFLALAHQFKLNEGRFKTDMADLKIQAAIDADTAAA